MPPKKQEADKLLSALLGSLPNLLRSMQWNRPTEALQMLQPLVAALKEAGVTKGLRPLEQSVKELEMRAQQGKVEVPQGLVRPTDAARGLDSLYLDEDVRRQAARFIQETAHADLLQRFHCTPRHRLLLSGPPRNGKTSMAEALAFELGLPFLVANSAALLESHLGDTSKNLAKVFGYASSLPCLLFLDEVDTYATSRSAGHDVGEMARITNTLLQLLDRLPATCIFVAATNRYEELDRAFLGRMQLRIEVPLPSRDTLLLAARSELRAELTPGYDATSEAEEVVEKHSESVAQIIQACEALRRDLALQSAGIARLGA